MDLEQLKRDARSVWQTLTGSHPPSFSHRRRPDEAIDAAPPAAPQGAPAEPAAQTEASVITARIDGRPYTFSVAPGQTILAAAQAQEVPLRHSCAMGGCGACRIELRSGEVELDDPNCLSDGERAQGYVLCCVGRPRTERVELEGYA